MDHEELLTSSAVFISNHTRDKERMTAQIALSTVRVKMFSAMAVPSAVIRLASQGVTRPS